MTVRSSSAASVAYKESGGRPESSPINAHAMRNFFREVWPLLQKKTFTATFKKGLEGRWAASVNRCEAVGHTTASVNSLTNAGNVKQPPRLTMY